MDTIYLNRVIERLEKQAVFELRKTEEEPTIEAIINYLEVIEKIKKLINYKTI